MNIIDSLANSEQIIDIHPFMKRNDNLNNFTNNKISMVIPVTQTEMFDANSDITSFIKRQISSKFSIDISRKLFDTNEFEYLDVRPNLLVNSKREVIEKLVMMIFSSGYKNLITTGLISSELQDSPYFHFNRLKFTNNSTFYSPGKIGDVSIWIDPYMSYKDTRICLFNDIDFNLGSIKSRKSISDFAPSVEVEYYIDFGVSDSKIILIIENEDSEAFKHFIRLQRSVKINNILGDDEKN